MSNDRPEEASTRSQKSRSAPVKPFTKSGKIIEVSWSDQLGEIMVGAEKLGDEEIEIDEENGVLRMEDVTINMQAKSM